MRKNFARFLLLLTAIWAPVSVTQVAGTDLPREHLSLDANWKFHLGDDWPTRCISKTPVPVAVRRRNAFPILTGASSIYRMIGRWNCHLTGPPTAATGSRCSA